MVKTAIFKNVIFRLANLLQMSVLIGCKLYNNITSKAKKKKKKLETPSGKMATLNFMKNRPTVG